MDVMRRKYFGEKVEIWVEYFWKLGKKIIIIFGLEFIGDFYRKDFS